MKSETQYEVWRLEKVIQRKQLRLLKLQDTKGKKARRRRNRLRAEINKTKLRIHTVKTLDLLGV